MDKVDRLINYIRNIREDVSPTMNTSTPNGNPGFSASADSQGPNSGFDSVVGITTMYTGKRKKIDYRKVPMSYKGWVKFIENK